MNSAGLDAVEGEFTTERIGTLDKDKSRPLKVKFDFKLTAFGSLANAKSLNRTESESKHLRHIAYGFNTKS